MPDFTIMIPSNRPAMAEETQKCLTAFDSIVVDGTDAESYSEVANQCIVQCPTEVVIICNDKGRPKEEDVLDLYDLIMSGYGMAWFHPFGFGGFPKETIRRLGFYDERYKDGNYEDCDLYRRLREADLALYEEFRIHWVTVRSSWSKGRARRHFRTKWGTHTVNRNLPEEEYPYDIGPHVEWEFLDWSHTVSPGKDGFNEIWGADPETLKIQAARSRHDRLCPRRHDEP